MTVITQVIDVLQKLTNSKINQSDIARALGITRATVSARVKNNSMLSYEEIKKIENIYNVDLTKQTINTSDDTVTLDYFPDVCGSCGNGVFQFSTYKEQMVVQKNNFCTRFAPHKKYFVINAYGDSMQPLIYDKDKLIVEHWEGEQIIDNKPYIFCRNDEIFVKRLVKNVNQLLIIPDNKAYDTIKLTDEQMNEVDIIGQIVGLMRDLR